MAALPKKRVSRARSGKRVATQGYKIPELTACSHCGNLKPGHIVCPHCGYYKERLVLAPKQTTKVTKVKET